MGKVHRIKKQFWQLVSQKPLPLGDHRLAKVVSVYIGKSYQGNHFVMQPFSTSSYKGLICQLIKEYEAGVAPGDETPIKG